MFVCVYIYIERERERGSPPPYSIYSGPSKRPLQLQFQSPGAYARTPKITPLKVLGFRVQGSGFGGLAFRVHGSGSGGLAFRVQGSGFGV